MKAAKIKIANLPEKLKSVNHLSSLNKLISVG